MVTINCPLHKSTRGLFDQVMLTNMKQGAYLVNTARGAIVDRDALVKVMESGHLAGALPSQFCPSFGESAMQGRHSGEHEVESSGVHRLLDFGHALSRTDANRCSARGRLCVFSIRTVLRAHDKNI